MKNIRKSKSFKTLAVATAFIHLIQIFSPNAAFALTSGPSSPEFSSFEPVATTDMVNLFGGDFTYNLPVINIPGPEGSGYALSLSYNSGTSPEEEASWVGYGWSLNPGAVNRQVRGLPDDYANETIKKYNKVRPNWSQTLGRNMGIEAFSVDVAFDESIRFNNNVGLSKSWGFSLGYKGMASLGFTRQDGETTLNYNVNPSAFMSKKKKKDESGTDEEKEKPVKDEKKGLKQMIKDENKKIKDAPNISMKQQNYKKLGKAGCCWYSRSIYKLLRSLLIFDFQSAYECV